VNRAMKKLRRASVKLVDATKAQSRVVTMRVRKKKVEIVKRLLDGIVGVLEGSSEVRSSCRLGLGLKE
jgi:hypothetical protein